MDWERGGRVNVYGNLFTNEFHYFTSLGWIRMRSTNKQQQEEKVKEEEFQ